MTFLVSDNNADVYELTEEKVNFETAITECGKIGGQVARIETVNNLKEVEKFLNGKKVTEAWIGLMKVSPFMTRPSTASCYSTFDNNEIKNMLQWTQGNDTAVTELPPSWLYSYWGKIESRFSSCSEECLYISATTTSSKLFDSLTCTTKRYVVCSGLYFYLYVSTNKKQDT